MLSTDKLLWNDIVRIIFYRLNATVFGNENGNGVDSNVTVTNHVITKANLFSSIYD